MAESSSFNNVTRQIAREDILNNQCRESFKSYIIEQFCYFILHILVQNMFWSADVSCNHKVTSEFCHFFVWLSVLILFHFSFFITCIQSQLMRKIHCIFMPLVKLTGDFFYVKLYASSAIVHNIGVDNIYWSISTARQKKTMEACQWRMERKVLGITLKDRVSNARLQNITATVSIGQRATATKWKWGGHVARLKDDRWAQVTTMWDPYGRKRTPGRPRRRW